MARGQWHTLAGGMCFGIVWMSCQAVMPAVIGRAIDRGVAAKDTSALVTYALNGEGPTKHMSKRMIGAAYTLLGGKPTEGDDDFLRVRALQAKFKVSDDFVEFVRSIDDTVGRLEQKDISKFMVLMGSVMKTLRGRIGRLIEQGKSVEQTIALKPTADFDLKWANGPIAANDIVKEIYADLSRKMH